MNNVREDAFPVHLSTMVIGDFFKKVFLREQNNDVGLFNFYVIGN